ncbi:MAG: FxDxF family PEP-CTERM protein [Pseudomonadota bacterium]
MKITALTLCAALACASGTAFASSNTEDWGVHDLTGESNTNTLVNGAFTDYYKFMVPDGFNGVTSVSVANQNPPGFHISDGMYSLYSYGPDMAFGGGDDALVGGSWAFDGSTGATQHTAAVTTGGYYYLVTGLGDGSGGKGKYTITSNITPVPEPASWAMLLLGLGGLAWARSRRAP